MLFLLSLSLWGQWEMMVVWGGGVYVNELKVSLFFSLHEVKTTAKGLAS